MVPVAPLPVDQAGFYRQYTSYLKVCRVRDLGLSREYSKKLFVPMFYLWCNYCPLNNKPDRIILLPNFLPCYTSVIQLCMKTGKCYKNVKLVGFHLFLTFQIIL